ncbi:MAG: twin-arginine translocase TatA/TatE family subunit [Planctomycetaceae bacterium]|jgi:sec-independent protein translocase protein TatA|nr:twin-arginine translocase TatA/TatE family subunit [Planctomycetaceae bacterium]
MLFGFIPGAPGWIEIAIFGVIILLVFGNRLPGAMKSLGRSVVEFKKGASDADSEGSDDGRDDRKDS